MILVVAIVAKVVPSAPLGVILAYLNERFPASVRASGYGIGYMFGLILPGLYSVWLLALSAVMPYAFGPVVLIVFGGLLMFVAVRRGPETSPPGGDPAASPATGAEVTCMILTDEEKGMRDGLEGPAVAAAMDLLVRYGEALDAERLVETRNVAGTMTQPSPAKTALDAERRLAQGVRRDQPRLRRRLRHPRHAGADLPAPARLRPPTPPVSRPTRGS